VVNFVVPAAIMHFTVTDWKPLPSDEQVILLGYAASILTHMWVNADTFQIAITG
jgi:hypothetical protein